MYDRSTRERAMALVSTGLSVNAVSKQLGISRSAIRRWQLRGDLTPLGWMAVECFRCTPAPRDPPDEAAYAHLLGWYLGDGHIVLHHRGVYWLSIVCDAAYPGLNAEIADVLVRVKPGGRVSVVAQPGCVESKLYWKHWPCLFPQHGPGRKHTRPIALAAWQRDIVKRHPGLFLRGLFHSDGSRIVNWTEKLVDGERKRYEYPRYFFSNKSEDILGLCTWALDLLDIAWRRPNARHISVARKAAVARLDEHVGPKY